MKKNHKLLCIIYFRIQPLTTLVMYEVYKVHRHKIPADWVQPLTKQISTIKMTANLESMNAKYQRLIQCERLS